MKFELELIPIKKDHYVNSRAIADFTGKEHFNVLRDIRKIIEDLNNEDNSNLKSPKKSDNSNLVALKSTNPSLYSLPKGIIQKTYLNSQNKEQPYYLLDYSMTMTLLTGYSVKLRKMVIDRWMSLEKEFAKTRRKSIDMRNNFTDTLKEHGYKSQHEYIQTTTQMKKVFGITSKKESMTEKELKLVTAAEYVADCLIDDEYGYHEVNPVCIEASENVANLIEAKKQRKLLA